MQIYLLKTAAKMEMVKWCLINGWKLAGQEQFSGGNFHTNKDAGGMWCRDHSHRGQSANCLVSLLFHASYLKSKLIQPIQSFS